MPRFSSRQPVFRQKNLALLISAMFLPFTLSLPALAAPQGGVVTSGEATIIETPDTNTTTINQTTDRVSINWGSFSIAPNERVDFQQPGSSAIALNRVIGNERSVIEGALTANGRVFLVNSNGVLFSQGAQVNVGGLVASAHNISDENFNMGNYVFGDDASGTGAFAGTVVNNADINFNGGYIAMLGNRVSNNGRITAESGVVALAAGDTITLTFQADKLLSVTVDQGALNALVENNEAIYADGGTVILTARAASDLLSAQVNNSGIVQARTLDDLTAGNISLNANGGTVNVSGTLDASSGVAGGDGGAIATTGDTVRIADSATITAAASDGSIGSWQIASDSFTIGAAGNMSGTALGNALANSNVSIQTRGSGDIDIDGAVSWSADTTLALNAAHDVNINNAINASGENARLVMTYAGDYHILTRASFSGAEVVSEPVAGTPGAGGIRARQDTSGGVYGSVTLSGDNASLNINGNEYTLIHDMDQLAATSGVNGHYALAQDITSSAQYTSSVVANFSGTLAGMGHTIDGLTISGTGNTGTGMVGRVATGSTIRDIGLTNVNVFGTGNYVGALIGYGAQGLNLHQAYVTGEVAGGNNVGGLVSLIAANSSATYVFSEANVRGTNAVGGLFGSASGSNSVSNAHTTGSVTSNGQQVGGMIGSVQMGNYSNLYSTSTVTGTSSTYRVGGLIGYVNASTATGSFELTDSFATGNVSGGYAVGGLIGEATTNLSNPVAGVIHNVYAEGDVMVTGSTGSPNTQYGGGGLIGALTNNTQLSYAHATGNVSAAAGSNIVALGGLVGRANGGNTTVVSHTYATGGVISNTAITNGANAGFGGLVGVNDAVIENSYAEGDVSLGDQGATGVGRAGGLVGMNGWIIRDSQAYGDVTGIIAGGLVGYNYYDSKNPTQPGTISGSDAYGDVTSNAADGSGSSGGLVGSNTGNIADSIAHGAASGGANSGGLVGNNSNEITWAGGTSAVSSGNITDSHWNSDVNAGGVGQHIDTTDPNGNDRTSNITDGNSGVGGGSTIGRDSDGNIVITPPTPPVEPPPQPPVTPPVNPPVTPPVEPPPVTPPVTPPVEPPPVTPPVEPPVEPPVVPPVTPTDSGQIAQARLLAQNIRGDLATNNPQQAEPELAALDESKPLIDLDQYIVHAPAKSYSSDVKRILINGVYYEVNDEEGEKKDNP